MSGETNLSVLLSEMQPELLDGIYVFCSVPENEDKRKALGLPTHEQFRSQRPRAVFEEKEGSTYVLLDDKAEAIGVPEKLRTYPSRLITINVNSSLEAVGFLAAMTKVLGDEKISVNAFSAFYHDHLFVPEDRAKDAVAALERLSLNAEAELKTAAEPSPTVGQSLVTGLNPA